MRHRLLLIAILGLLASLSVVSGCGKGPVAVETEGGWDDGVTSGGGGDPGDDGYEDDGGDDGIGQDDDWVDFDDGGDYADDFDDYDDGGF